jgi:hypothetical protein
MQFEIGRPDYPLEHQGEILGGVIAGEKRKDLPLRLVTMERMTAEHKAFPSLRGVPVMIAWDRKEQRVWVFPNPAGEYVFHVELGEGEPGALKVGSPPVALPADIGQPHPTETRNGRDFIGTLTKPMLKRGK